MNLFKVWCKSRNTWLTSRGGSYLVGQDGKIYFHDPTNTECSLIELDQKNPMDYEVVWFTNAFDCNKTPIYNGDIVKEGCNGLIGVVSFDEESCTYKLKGFGDYYIKDAAVEWTVIGNIYENPSFKEV